MKNVGTFGFLNCNGDTQELVTHVRVMRMTTYNSSAVTGNGFLILVKCVVLVPLILELNGRQFMF